VRSLKFIIYMCAYSNIYPKRCSITQFILSGTALHISGGTSTHHQERKQLYLQHLVFVTLLLLPAAIIRVCVHILIYIQQDATLRSLFYLETVLHVSGCTSTHQEERKQLYLQHLVFVTPLLLPAARAADSSNRVTNTRCC